MFVRWVNPDESSYTSWINFKFLPQSGRKLLQEWKEKNPNVEEWPEKNPQKRAEMAKMIKLCLKSEHISPRAEMEEDKIGLPGKDVALLASAKVWKKRNFFFFSPSCFVD